MITFGNNLPLRQGATYDETFVWSQIDEDTGAETIVDLSGVTAARLQLRVSADAPDPALADISLTPNANGQIIVGGTAGSVRVILNPAVTTALIAASVLKGVFDLYLTYSTGAVQCFMAGQFTVAPGVTK